MEELQDDTTKRNESWQALLQVILARIILFNQRRSAEVSKMTLEDFNNKSLPNGQKVVLEGLSKVEQELCRSFQRVEIRGKRGNTVPVLLTTDMVDAIDLLNQQRKGVGVSNDNKFLFARANYGSLGHVRGCDCLQELAPKSGAKMPTFLRCTALRKQIATVSQIMNLKDNELDILAKLGLVYWGLTPQQQPGSYQGGEMMMKSVFLVEETGVPGGNHRPTASN